MLYTEHSNAARPCQWSDADNGHTPTPAAPSIGAWACTGSVDVGRVVATVARAYNETHPAAAVEVTPAAILGTGRQPDVAWARHVCAYLLVEDYHLTNIATAQVLGRADHTTIVNSRARIAVALPRDNLLTRVLDRVHTDLTGHHYDERMRARRDEDRRRDFAVATPRELAEYRYWRLRALRTAATGWGVRDGL